MRAGHLAAFLLLTVANVGCSLQPVRTSPAFETLAEEPRVRFEVGGEHHARRVAELLPEAVSRVEAAHYSPFAEAVTVHVCVTDACFDSQVSTPNVSGATVPDNRVFLSPRLFGREAHRLPLILAHELSHLHLGQRLGHYSPAVPVWFHEGLAAYASGGGGADYASEEEARANWLAGRAFSPAVLDTPEKRHRAESWNLSPYLFYRQAMMFLKYLKSVSEAGFRDFLLRVQSREDFAAAFTAAFGFTLAEAGQRFLESLSVAAAPAAPGD